MSVSFVKNCLNMFNYTSEVHYIPVNRRNYQLLSMNVQISQKTRVARKMGFVKLGSHYDVWTDVWTNVQLGQ